MTEIQDYMPEQQYHHVHLRKEHAVVHILLYQHDKNRLPIFIVKAGCV